MIGKREARWKRLKAAGEAANQSASVVTFQANCFPCSGVLYIKARPKGGGIVIPKKSRKLESNKFLLVESGIQGTFTCGIWNPGLWDPGRQLKKSGIQRKIGIRNPSSSDKEFSIWNPESTAWNPESKTVLDSLTRGDQIFERTGNLIAWICTMSFLNIWSPKITTTSTATKSNNCKKIRFEIREQCR